MAARNDPVELARRATLDLPPEHLGIEPARRLWIVTRQIHEDPGVRLHGGDSSIVGLLVCPWEVVRARRLGPFPCHCAGRGKTMVRRHGNGLTISPRHKGEIE